MNMPRHRDTVKKLNPRSTGEINAQIYTKHSEEICLEQEALELERCTQQALHTKHIFTPELVSYDKSKNLLSTKLIVGNELFLTLWNPTSLLGKLRGKKLQDVELITSRLVELGSWLSMYHKSTSYPEDNRLAMLWLRNSAIAKLNGIRDSKLMAVKKINEIEQSLLNEIDNLKKPEYLVNNNIEICRIHGDFIIYNMIIDKQSNLHILDFGDTRIACNLDDVARVYSNLWAIAHTNNWRKSLFSSVANDFLMSYGLETSIVETPYFKSMMAYNFLIHLYGQFCMRNLLSLVSYMELNQVTKAGLKWIDANFI